MTLLGSLKCIDHIIECVTSDKGPSGKDSFIREVIISVKNNECTSLHTYINIHHYS